MDSGAHRSRDEPSTTPTGDPDARPTLPDPSVLGAERPVVEAPPRAGRLGRYELLFELARGGMGTVYVGRLVGAHGFDRLVAIKRLTGDDADVEAFLAEARLSARILHPNVVQTFELGEHDGAPFIVMQLIEGVSLAKLLAKHVAQGEAIDADVAAWVIAQAAKGLHAAHELRSVDGRPLGLVHRDVSPQNLLLSYEGRVYVTDFGIAKLRDSRQATQSGVVKGKFAYMSPEQARAQPVDRRSDVFALGICLYESLVGARLFQGDSPAETVLRIVEHVPKSPREVRPEVPEEIVPIVLRCLAKKREDRFATAAELADALREYLRGRHARVDETDLAALLDRTVHEERERLSETIRAALTAADVVAPPAEVSPGTLTAASAVAGIDAPRRRRWLVPVLGAVVVAGAAVGAWGFGGLGRGTAAHPTGEATSGIAAAPGSTSTSTSTSTPTSTLPSATAIASVTGAATAPSSTQPPRVRGSSGAARAPASASAPKVTSAPTVPPSQPTTSSGTPFRSLD
jgi:serine/threonine protein kinase